MVVSNFPVQATPFVGRSGELAEIAARLRDPACRLLTLVGPGGIGKTRLAQEAAQQTTFADSVFFVPLQPLTSAEFIVTAINEALRLSLSGEQDSRTQLLAYLQNKHLLLVLDNFEHLLDDADLLLEILEVAPEVKLLVTSRERLRLREEWVMDVHGLSFPEQANSALVEDYGAVQLFAQSTRRIGTTLRAEDTPHIVHICQLVGGIPLAIELAAAWTRTISCQQIGHELERSLDILETSLLNTEPRHRNMRTAFEPTWQHLTGEEQNAFMRLSVFRGGFTAEAAGQVAGASLPTLHALVDKSLLLSERGRNDLHELLRQYGEERLETSGLADHVREAHSIFYARFVQERVEDIKGRRQTEALKEVAADFENVRTAWLWASVHRHESCIQTMMEGLWLFCKIRNRYQESRMLFGYAEQHLVPEDGNPPSRLWGRLLARAVEQNPGSRPQIETALQLAQQDDDPGEIAYCLNRLAIAVYSKSEPEKAERLLEQSLMYYRRLGDLYYTAQAMTDYNLFYTTGGWDSMAVLAEEALRLHTEIGDKAGMAMGLWNKAVDAGRKGHYVECERLWRERIALGKEVGSPELVALGNAHLSTKVYFVVGDFDKARAAAEEALRFRETIGPAYHNVNGWALAALGLLASMNENYQDGQALCGQVSPDEVSDYVAVYAAWGAAVAACGLEDYDTAATSFAVGLGVPDIQGTVGIILCLPVAAILLAHQSSPVRAVELLALAFTHPVRAFGWMEKWPLLTRFQMALKQQLGPEVYAAAWERGRLLDADKTLVELRQQFPIALSAEKEASGQSPDPLTKRELEILRLVADGSSNKEIANRLYVGVSTVKKHINHIYSKLDAKNRTQAVARARDRQILV